MDCSVGLLGKQSQTNTQSQCHCPLTCHLWTLWISLGIIPCFPRQKQQKVSTSTVLAHPFQEKSVFSCSNNQLRESVLSVNFSDLPEEGRKRTATVIHKVPRRSGAVRVTSSQSIPFEGEQSGCVNATVSFVVDRQPEVSPCPSLALAAYAQPLRRACFLWHMGGREIISFFPLFSLYEGAHKSLPWPLLEKDNNKRAVPSFLFWRIFREAAEALVKQSFKVQIKGKCCSVGLEPLGGCGGSVANS